MIHHTKAINSFVDYVKVQLPIIQAPMAGVQDSKLAIAVCQAGGLGSLPGALLSLQKIESEIASIRQATDAPFNVNFFAHQQPDYTQAMQEKWLNALQPYYQEFGLTQDEIATTGGRQPFTHEQAALLADLKVPVVSFHFGLPDKALLNIVRHHACGSTLVAGQWGGYDYRAGIGSGRTSGYVFKPRFDAASGHF